MGLSISRRSVKIERKGKCKGKGVFASLFGVGAPEVLVIGVVALLVFGPKGLAEVARNLGKTLRAFQPTIRELQEVSREFKSTLEREIGLDDIDTPVPKRPSSNATNPTPEADIEPKPAVDKDLKMRADQFTGALAQLQKEQEEERERENAEKEREKENAQSEAELQTSSEDTSESLDAPTEASSVTPPSENPDNGVLQEAASVAPTNASPNAESQS